MKLKLKSMLIMAQFVVLIVFLVYICDENKKLNLKLKKLNKLKDCQNQFKDSINNQPAREFSQGIEFILTFNSLNSLRIRVELSNFINASVADPTVTLHCL